MEKEKTEGSVGGDQVIINTGKESVFAYSIVSHDYTVTATQKCL